MATLRRKLVSINQFLEWAIQSTVPVVKPVASLLSSKLPAVKPLTQPAMQPAAGGNAPAQEAYLIPLAIEKVLNQYLTTLKYNSASDATIRNYRSDIKQFAAFIRENTLEKLLVLNNLKRFALSQKEKGLKATSVQRKLTSITQFALWALRKRLISTASGDWSAVALDSVFSPTSTDSPILVTKATPEEAVKLGKSKRWKEGWLAY